MPHYRDGTKARIGDVVKAQPTVPGPFIVGPLLTIQEEAETCNGTMQQALQVHESAHGERVVTRVVTIGAPGQISYVTLKDCDRVA